jgi:predicted RND superfamily exporter protein
MINKYTNFLDKYKYIVIISITLAVLLLSISLKNLSFEGSYKIWFDKNSKILKDYEKFRYDFSGDDTFFVAFENRQDPNGVFNPITINTIISLTDEFEQIDGVDEVMSLTNYQYMSDKNNSFNVDNFIQDNNNLNVKKQIALKDNLILHQLINTTGTASSIAIRLSEDIGKNEDVNIFVFKQIKKIVAKYEQTSNLKFYISGIPAVTASLVIISQKDGIVLIPLAVLIVVIMLFVIFRNPIGVVVPSIVIVFTFLTVLSIQIILGYKLNNFTINIPSFVSAIAIADAIHLYIAWQYYKNQNFKNKQAVYLALKYNIFPIFLTSITTAVGFATLGVSNIVPVSTLGIAITTAAILAFLFSITMAPAILLILNDSFKVKKILFLEKLQIQGYGRFIKKYNIEIITIFSIIFLVLGYGLTKTKIDSNSIKYFKPNTTVRDGSDFIQQNLTGAMIYEIIIDTKKSDGIKDYNFLMKIVDFENQLYKNFKNVRFSTSIKDIIAREQKVLNPTSKDIIPKNKDLIAQYLLLYSMNLNDGKTINDKISSDYSKIRITINSDIQDTSKDIAMIKWINNYWKSTPYTSQVQGQTAIFAYMQDSVTNTLVISIVSTTFIVAFLMLLLFKNIKMVLLFILPNIAPLVLVAGVMGYMDITIDIGVAISAAVILGIAVDDTIHFFSKYFYARKSMTFEQSIDYVINHSAGAMILTTIILSFTFLVFMFSSFVPNVNFAIVTIVALNIALLLDLLLLPALLSFGNSTGDNMA